MSPVTNYADGKTTTRSYHVVAVIPIYNDWQSAELLLERLDEIAGQERLHLHILLVDDCSSQPCRGFPPGSLTCIHRVSVLRLRRNLGHQRAIAVALAYVEANVPCEAVLIMDGDGEDDPNDVPRLIHRLQEIDGTRIVFAERTRRSEGFVFRAGYAAYRVLHWALTGLTVRVGNFSVVSHRLLRRLVVLSELWNHYAAAVLKARVPHERLPTVRATRLVGHSHMNFVSLVVHGLSALSVFSEIIGVRLLVLSCGLTAVLGGVLLLVLSIRLFTDLAIPGWASTMAGVSLLLLGQALMTSIVFVFIVLQGRGNTTFLPARDYAHFIDEQTESSRVAA